jgi:hypothetical protein
MKILCPYFTLFSRVCTTIRLRLASAISAHPLLPQRRLLHLTIVKL